MTRAKLLPERSMICATCSPQKKRKFYVSIEQLQVLFAWKEHRSLSICSFPFFIFHCTVAQEKAMMHSVFFTSISVLFLSLAFLSSISLPTDNTLTLPCKRTLCKTCCSFG